MVRVFKRALLGAWLLLPLLVGCVARAVPGEHPLTRDSAAPIGYVRLADVLRIPRFEAVRADEERQLAALQATVADPSLSTAQRTLDGERRRLDAALRRDVATTQRLLEVHAQRLLHEERLAITTLLRTSAPTVEDLPLLDASALHREAAQQEYATLTTTDRETQAERRTIAIGIADDRRLHAERRRTSLDDRAQRLAVSLARADADERVSLRLHQALLSPQDPHRAVIDRRLADLAQSEQQRLAAQRLADAERARIEGARTDLALRHEEAQTLARLRQTAEAVMQQRHAVTEQQLLAVAPPFAQATVAPLTPQLRRRLLALHRRYQLRLDQEAATRVASLEHERLAMQRRLTDLARRLFEAHTHLDAEMHRVVNLHHEHMLAMIAEVRSIAVEVAGVHRCRVVRFTPSAHSSEIDLTDEVRRRLLAAS